MQSWLHHCFFDPFYLGNRWADKVDIGLVFFVSSSTIRCVLSDGQILKYDTAGELWRIPLCKPMEQQVKTTKYLHGVNRKVVLFDDMGEKVH